MSVTVPSPDVDVNSSARQKQGVQVFGILLTPGVVWMSFFYLIPLFLIVAMSFGTSDEVGRSHYGWNPANYREVFDPTFLPVLLRTLLYGLVATAISATLGFTVAYALAQYGGKRKALLLVAAIMPFFIDYLVRIYALVQIFRDDGLLAHGLQQVGLVGPDGISVLGHTPMVIGALVYNYLPLMILPIYVALEQIDRSVIEAGRDLFATPAQVLWKLTIPLSVAGIAGGCLLVFLCTVGDFVTAQLLGSPRNYMLGNLISNQFNGASSVPVGAGLTVILILLLAVVAVVYSLRSNASTAATR